MDHKNNNFVLNFALCAHLIFANFSGLVCISEANSDYKISKLSVRNSGRPKSLYRVI